MLANRIALPAALDALALAIATQPRARSWVRVMTHDGRVVGYQIGVDAGLWGDTADAVGDEAAMRLAGRLRQVAAWSRGGGAIGRRHVARLLSAAALYRGAPAIEVAIEEVKRTQAPRPAEMVKRWVQSARDALVAPRGQPRDVGTV